MVKLEWLQKYSLVLKQSTYLVWSLQTLFISALELQVSKEMWHCNSFNLCLISIYKICFSCEKFNDQWSQTQIASKVRLHVRRIVLKNGIYYKYETSSLTPFVKPHNVLNFAVQNIFGIRFYVQSGVDHQW